jgi:pyruvate/2-oxoglutarate dehydrogenase complex dihydrolipoamide acyltransferase (E2) component
LILFSSQGLTQNISAPSDQSEHSQNKSSQGRGRDPPDRGAPGPPAAKRPRPAAANATTPSSSRLNNSFKKENISSNSGSGLNADGRRSHDDDDDIQEVVPVKTEPRDLQPATAAAAAASTAMTAVTTASYATPSREEGGSEGGGQLALDEDYAEDNYDYGEYDGDGGGGLYGDDSGLMDPNTGLPIPAGSDGNKGRVKTEKYF